MIDNKPGNFYKRSKYTIWIFAALLSGYLLLEVFGYRAVQIFDRNKPTSASERNQAGPNHK